MTDARETETETMLTESVEVRYPLYHHSGPLRTLEEITEAVVEGGPVVIGAEYDEEGLPVPGTGSFYDADAPVVIDVS